MSIFSSVGIRHNNIGNDFHPVLQNVYISNEDLLQLVSDTVLNNSECNEKSAQHKNNLKI